MMFMQCVDMQRSCRYLYIMGFSVPSFAISFSSAALGLAFIFGDSLRKVYESIVWLFGVNPYDAGAALLFHAVQQVCVHMHVMHACDVFVVANVLKRGKTAAGVVQWCAGDYLLYNDSFARVDKFGLLNTQLVLTNGSRLWVRCRCLPPLLPHPTFSFHQKC
jgi:hypothetical protein